MSHDDGKQDNWRATQLRNQGVALEDIAFILGHGSLKTTQDYYAHVELERIAGVLRERR